MRLALLGLPLVLGACAFAGDVVAIGVGGAAGAATGSPAVGYAAGLGARAGIQELRRYVVRRRWREEHDAIAEVAGAAPLNQTRAWEIRYTIPLGNERGELSVVREFATPIATCREVVFTVVDDGARALFTTTLCRDAERWRWAAAEPAVERWGSLQ